MNRNKLHTVNQVTSYILHTANIHNVIIGGQISDANIMEPNQGAVAL